jgi:single-strand DNA-binding protein
MAGSVNKVILLGNLGKDPDVRNTATGQRVATLSVATSDVWKDKSGQRQEKTEWHRVVIFNAALAEVAAKYLHRGSKVYVEGALQSRKWTDSNGMERVTTEIILSNFKGELAILDAKSADAGSSDSFGDTSDNGWDNAPVADGADDSIPF